MALITVFFGTSEFAVFILQELKKANAVPTLIVTAPDKPQGRKLIITPPPVKVWAEQNGVDVLQPERLDNPEVMENLSNTDWDLFIVASYGGKLPKELLDVPAHGTLNVHPSLLPKFRGASPIRSAILADEKETGVTIMLLDEKIDHGPIVAQASITPNEWPPKALELEKLLAHEGGKLLAEVVPLWIGGKITAETQDHARATYSKKITKEDGMIDLSEDQYNNFLKIRALDGWPGTYFFVNKNGKKVRVKIVDAEYTNETLHILRVIPEGKKEMSYQDFIQNIE